MNGDNIKTRCANYDDYRQPFQGGQGPAPADLMSPNDSNRKAVLDCWPSDYRIRKTLRAICRQGTGAPKARFDAFVNIAVGGPLLPDDGLSFQSVNTPGANRLDLFIQLMFWI